MGYGYQIDPLAKFVTAPDQLPPRSPRLPSAIKTLPAPPAPLPAANKTLPAPPPELPSAIKTIYPGGTVNVSPVYVNNSPVFDAEQDDDYFGIPKSQQQQQLLPPPSNDQKKQNPPPAPAPQTSDNTLKTRSGSNGSDEAVNESKNPSKSTVRFRLYFCD